MLREDARFQFHKELWEARSRDLEASRLEALPWGRAPISDAENGAAKTDSGQEAGQGAVNSGAIARSADAAGEVTGEATIELRHAVLEAQEVLQEGAAWRYFEHDETSLGLFEFAERDLERLLVQLARGPSRDLSFGMPAAGPVSADRWARTLAAALRTQTQALRSYRHT